MAPLLSVLLAARHARLPALPEHVWRKVQDLVGEEYFPEDVEGTFILHPRPVPTAGVRGDGLYHLELLFVGTTFGRPRHGLARWFEPDTTTNQLPSFVADLVCPGWKTRERRCTTRCCEVHWSLEDAGRCLMRFTLFDWQGLRDRPEPNPFESGAWHRERWLECESDQLAQYDAYFFYYCTSCACSFGYICHRLGQLQEARRKECFRLVDHQRPLGYGLREYDHTVQRRWGRFAHVPLVLASLPGPCRCGAERCSHEAVPARAVAQLSAKLHPAPVLELDSAASLRLALMALASEAQRLDAISKLAPVRVAKGARIEASLHLGVAGD